LGCLPDQRAGNEVCKRSVFLQADGGGVRGDKTYAFDKVNYGKRTAWSWVLENIKLLI